MDAPTRILRLAEITALSSLSKAQIYDLMREGRFPRPIKLTDGPIGRVGWLQGDWEAWVQQRRTATEQQTVSRTVRARARDAAESLVP